jgi:hypothetical protein
MSRLADARDRLHGALAHVFDEPVPVLGGDPVQFSPGRVHRYPPQDFVAPIVWIEQPRGQLRTDLHGTLASFPVAVVYDGADRAQVAGLDELVSRVWDAAAAAGDPVAFGPRPLDAGGFNLRATFVDVEIRIATITLCTPTIKEAVSV